MNQLLDSRRNDAFFKKKKRQSIHLRYEDSAFESVSSPENSEASENEIELEISSSRSRKRSKALYQEFDLESNSNSEVDKSYGSSEDQVKFSFVGPYPQSTSFQTEGTTRIFFEETSDAYFQPPSEGKLEDMEEEPNFKFGGD